MTAKKKAKAASKVVTGCLLYKLTDHLGQTFNKTQWGAGVTHTATGNPSHDLCTDAWIHAYTSPLLAVLLNPIHANFKQPCLWKARGIVGKTENGLKVGCRSLTTTQEIPLPQITITQRVAFGILCALEVNKDPQFAQWAENWLTAKDRTEATARSEAWSAAVSEAAWAAVSEARSAAVSEAAWAAVSAAVSEAAWSAAVSEAVSEAAWSAAWAAARSAAWDKRPINLIVLAKRAMKVK